MLSPSGYSGVLATPTAQVIPYGQASLSVSNNNPEIATSVTPAGSINFGVGLLPGLEGVGRLAFEGSIYCDMYDSRCNSKRRDLSVGAKYQLPIKLWNDSKVAIGVSDVGGSVTQFRQYYGVATTRWGALETSLGYGKSVSSSALLNGAFGNLRYTLTPQWQLLAEHDSKSTRAGLQYQVRLGDSADLVMALSRQLDNAGGQQANQFQMAVNFGLDRTTIGQKTLPTKPGVTQVDAVGVAKPTQATSALTSDGVKAFSTPTEGTTALDAAELADLLKQAGFSDIQVQFFPGQVQEPGVWNVRAESRAYRQSHVEAVGQALKPWFGAIRQQRVQANDQWNLTLTYQREPIVYARVQAQCLDTWVRGEACVNTDVPAVKLSSRPFPVMSRDLGGVDPAPQSASASASSTWAPQFALSPALRNTVGTEYGLFDYSLAAQLGVEVNLAPGLFWQGIYLVPVKNSDDYEPGKVFSGSRFVKSQWHSSQLTYWKPLFWGIKAQVSAGQLTPTDTGSQFDAIWTSPDGRWRASYTGGRYRSDLIQREQVPEFVQLRYSVIPGQWHVEATGGRFMASDTGYKVASVHWFGDTRFALQYQRTGTLARANIPYRAFLGFAISVPIGPKAAQSLGPVTVRGQDRWNWGLQTKVGEADNYITTGYGEFPRQRHGLWSDVMDHDRNGDADLAAQLPRLRRLLSQ